MNKFEIFYLLLNILWNLKTYTVNSKSHQSEILYKQIFNTSNDYTIWDTSNIPEDILSNHQKLEDILEIMATRKYRSCKASVLFHPIKNIFYFRNPTLAKSGRGSGSMKEYMKFKCKSFLSRTFSQRQRFFIPFKDIEQVLDNNEDSIFLEGIHEISDLRKGLEMSFFPVKFHKSLPEMSYSLPKDLLCYDSIKVLGIDKNNHDYLIISALDKHKILYCDSSDENNKYNLNYFIRYSSYCDEFCAEDFIYFSNDLIKCKCDFFSYVEDLKKNKNFIINNNGTDGCYYSRRLDRYEIFANPYEIAEKITKYEGRNKSYYRYYLHCIIVLFTIQIIYAFYFITKNSLFIKFTIMFYIILAIIIYIPHRLDYHIQFDIPKICEVISDLYPVVLLIYIACDVNAKQYDIIKMAFLIFVNSFENILKDTQINEVELIIRLIFIITSFLLANTLDGSFLKFYNINIRIKNVFEFISRFSLFFAESGRFSDFTVPLFIILGRPRDGVVPNDHLLFQMNYLKLKPNFDKLYENWFMEALNFHKFKNMILFLKFARYFIILIILSFLNVYKEMNKMFSLFISLKISRAFSAFLSLSYNNAMNIRYSSSKIINNIHIPILISHLFTNVFLTNDCFKIFSVQYLLGFLIHILFGEKNKMLKFNLSKNNANNTTNITNSSIINNSNNEQIHNGNIIN